MAIVRVVGGPGTGKTTRLIDAAAGYINGGGDPESVLLLTPGRVSADVRGELTRRLLAARSAEPCRAVVREPLVRSVHSYAFGVLRKAADRAGDPPPRLVTGAEQDAIVRELLAGDLEDGARGWPRELRPALTTVAFATQLRDLVSQCAQRGVDGPALTRLGRERGRPEWVAAGRFAQQYEQVMLLRAAVGTAAPQATVPALSAADLVGAALEAFATDEDLLAAERARVRMLLVDDAQHFDPQAARLVRVLAGAADTAVIAGDPHQAVFGFRGADARLLLADPDVTLEHSHRCAPAIARAIGGFGRFPLEGSGEVGGDVTVTVAASAHAECSLIADTLRRAHLVDGVPWSQLAVIVRSVEAAAALPRTLAAAGVPVDLSPLAGPITDQPAVRALLTVLEAVVDGLDAEQAEALLTGPVGRLDPVSLRQLRRILRRNGIGLTDMLTGRVPQLPPALAAPVRRLRAVLAAAGRAHRDNPDPRYTLWQAWERSGLQRRWITAADRGGVECQWAERSLAAVTALFDVAEDYVARTTGASVPGLLDHVAALQLPPVTHGPRARGCVAVLSLHGALGRDWDTVIIAGVQEGLWPNTTPRGGVLGTQQLLDTLDGLGELGEKVSARAPALAEERRLLIAAMGRARRRLIITAVDNEDGDDAALPSSFVTELQQWVCDDAQPAAPVPAPPVLSPAAVVGRLRAVVCAPDGSVGDDERSSAAAQLARLAAAGVPGADPSQWHGLDEISTDDPLWSGEHTVTLSPSTLQTLTDCPLRWMAERHGGGDVRALSSTLGSLVHALIAQPGASEAAMVAQLERVWADLPFDSPWFAANELDRHRAMLSAFVAWRTATRDELTEVGTEIDLTGEVADGVAVRGRIDRLERDAQGRLVVVDVKTGKTPVTKDDAQNHAQLGLYQLAVSAGLVDGTGHDTAPGGGRLVYLGKPTAGGDATEREQSALGADDAQQWRDAVRAAAAATAGPAFPARVNPGCKHCPIRPACPAHATGELP